jgi:hypothetical protein
MTEIPAPCAFVRCSLSSCLLAPWAVSCPVELSLPVGYWIFHNGVHDTRGSQGCGKPLCRMVWERSSIADLAMFGCLMGLQLQNHMWITVFTMLRLVPHSLLSFMYFGVLLRFADLRGGPSM